MARDQEAIICPPGVWTQLTNDDVTEITFQIITVPAYIRYTLDETTPTEDFGQYHSLGIGPLKVTMRTLVSLTGAQRVWAMPIGIDKTTIYVDHA